MPPRSGRQGEPIALVRLRSLSGGTLVSADDDDGAERLTPGEDVAGEIEVLLGRARPHEALELLERAGLSEAAARCVRARAFLMDGRVEEARAALGPRDHDEVALGDAALALAEGDLDRAERRVLAARTKHPRLVGPAYLLALVRVSRGDMQQGNELLSAVAKSVPSHAVARFQLGQILAAQGDPARAGTLYEMAWDLEPTFVSPPMALSEMLVESRQFGEALSILERVSQAAPSSLAPRHLQLRILLEVGEREGAVELGRQLHEQAPDDTDTNLLFADALLESDRTDEAMAILDGALSQGLEPAHAVRATRLRARVALMQRRVDEAMELLRSAARDAPPAVAGEVCLELVHIALAQERPDDTDLGLSLLTKSSDVSSLVSGALLARQHRLNARARALAERAKSLIPGTPAAAQLEGFIAALGS
jgi:tetratricopeptide (TPR) repeat protein